MQKVEVLSNDRSSTARESERKCEFDGTEIVQLKHEILREVGLVTPDDPTDPNIAQAKLMPPRRTLRVVIREMETTHEVLMETTRGILKSQSKSGWMTSGQMELQMGKQRHT